MGFAPSALFWPNRFEAVNLRALSFDFYLLFYLAIASGSVSDAQARDPWITQTGLTLPQLDIAGRGCPRTEARGGPLAGQRL